MTAQIQAQTKSILSSKTFWVNALTLVLAVLQSGGQLGPVQPVADAHPAGVAGAIAVANLVLRGVTNQGVHVVP